ncbi:MerR family transcriptional regulator [Asanoa ishikariensis]|uniref:DNA-binding transcriptional regulator, MerR family n=1 Tax=Asanoa ishikariensis TaxID=137265 RepID=A0A1H3USW2_9ACTN|nr:MerR family transcriptional regulator [Asanoa ishikariensis]GIF69438.1 MerR family transcriptional regulator [Asanoa ishikariensis]SDZ65326.1 DNA-binding transcriptional regulator, MerR family [Asanoa ishikariensis]
MRIGELSARTGASARSIRYYEQQGLLTAVRTSSGQRVFPEAAVERIRLIQRLFDAGLNSKRMYELLPCMTNPDIRTAWLTDRLRDERERMVVQLAQLAHAVSALDQIIEDMTLGDKAQPSAA